MFKKYFKLPLHLDDYGVFVWTSDKRMAFDWMVDIKNEDKARIVEQINKPTSDWPCKKLWSYKDGVVLCAGQPVIRMRGWGMLTGVGGHNLSAGQAVTIQDEFGVYIAERLNNNTNRA